MGIKFVQFAKNSLHHSGINRSPYTAMFGTSARVGLSSTSLPSEVICRLETEQDLLASLALPETKSTEETPPSNRETAPSMEETTPSTKETAPSTEETPPSTGEAPLSVLRTESSIGEQQSENSPAHHPPPNDQLDQRQSDIINQCLGASAAQMAQAERMVRRSRVDLVAGKIGDNVAVPIPLVD